jgi:hypothetical protein
MKWMQHNREKRELIFQLYEHELLDDKEYVLEINGPKIDGDKKIETSFGCGAKKANSEWTLKFSIPEGVQLHLGRYTFTVIGGPVQNKGEYLIASGFSYGEWFICHQAMTKRI